MKSRRWQKANYSPLQRQIDVFRVATQFLSALWWDKIRGNNAGKQRQRRAQWLVSQLLDLGPTFIKMGQALSTRADLIPLEYIEALGQLQDQVPPFSSQEAIAVIENELGSPIDGLFREFDRTPLAAASLGQVHRATLPTGEEVVVKVQRPGIESLFNLDFEVLHHLIRLLNRYLPVIRKYELEGLFLEFFSLLYQEIDYINEGKNAERFSLNFEDYTGIIVPKIYWQYTSKKVLTLEYLPGIKIDDRQTIEALKINPDRLIEIGISCYLKQLLEDGFFQSDPHPGNMAVREDGSIIFYDFGTMAEVKSLAKDMMVKTFFAVVRKDTEAVVSGLTYMGLLQPVPDMTPVKRMVAFLLERFREKPVDIKELEQIGNEVYLMFEQQPFRLPPQMMFVIKSITTLDGIARALNPQYNLLAASMPFFKNITKTVQKGSVVKELAKQAKDFIQNKFTQPSSGEKLIQVIQRLEERIEQGELQIRVKSIASDRALKRLNVAIKGLIYACVSGFALLGGIILLVGNYANWAIALFCFGGFWFILLVRTLIKLAIRERLDRLAEK